MRKERLARALRRDELVRRLAGDRADDVVIGIGRDPDDRRRNCILLYVPPDFPHPTPDRITIDRERVRVVRRERGGPILARPG